MIAAHSRSLSFLVVVVVSAAGFSAEMPSASSGAPLVRTNERNMSRPLGRFSSGQLQRVVRLKSQSLTPRTPRKLPIFSSSGIEGMKYIVERGRSGGNPTRFQASLSEDHCKRSQTSGERLRDRVQPNHLLTHVSFNLPPLLHSIVRSESGEASEKHAFLWIFTDPVECPRYSGHGP